MILPTIIDSVGALLLAAEALQSELAVDDLWWRGHSQSSWILQPSVHRLAGQPGEEWQVARLFMQRAGIRRANCPPQSDRAAWLFLMQHYRLPTRLLDWSESTLVAAFFACCDDPATDGALWSLNPYALNQISTGFAGTAPSDNVDVQGLMSPVFSLDGVDLDKIVAVVPDEVDVRMLVQQSVFTIHGWQRVIGGPRKSQYSSGFVRSFLVPSVAKPTILRQLRSLGIRRSTLFPDLESLADDVSMRFLTGIAPNNI